jgi:hypothetical protein
VLGTAPGEGPSRGVVMFFSGGAGTEWWAYTPPALDFLNGLRRDGFTVVQVRWIDPWLVAAPGEQAGPARLACRPATTIQWVHDNLYVSLSNPGLKKGECGFCITGQSGGASQVSYALSHYGLEDIVDAVIPTGGPPHAALAKGCLRNPGEDAYWFASPGPAFVIDLSYGYRGNGPCSRHDPAFTARWQQDSVDTGGSDYVHAGKTRIHFILIAGDPTVAPAHALDYAARLRPAPASPWVTVQSVPGTEHEIVRSPEGLAALGEALSGSANRGRKGRQARRPRAA